jgi:2-dehydro-3-deoxy-D-arabinonate dehydratase
MHLIRFRRNDSVQVGVVRDRHVSVLPVPTLAALLALPLTELRSLVEGYDGADAAMGDVVLLPPVDGRTEVWASGVTYEISREARVEESESSADVYRLVYDADRPELFFKAPAWRVVGDGQVVGIRADSTLDVPEPELALVVNRDGDIVGYTVSDDVSSRSIEGENPLYLPQAKAYAGACALGPAIRPVWEVEDPYGLSIALRIWRGGALAWEGVTTTSLLHRRLDELVRWLYAGQDFPDGAVLSTGTCLVPGDGFGLRGGDVIGIGISEVGTLTTGVVSGKTDLAWLADSGEPPSWQHPSGTTDPLSWEKP